MSGCAASIIITNLRPHHATRQPYGTLADISPTWLTTILFTPLTTKCINPSPDSRAALARSTSPADHQIRSPQPTQTPDLNPQSPPHNTKDYKDNCKGRRYRLLVAYSEYGVDTVPGGEHFNRGGRSGMRPRNNLVRTASTHPLKSLYHN
jgi:hypothetical protein